MPKVRVNALNVGTYTIMKSNIYSTIFKVFDFFHPNIDINTSENDAGGCLFAFLMICAAPVMIYNYFYPPPPRKTIKQHVSEQYKETKTQIKRKINTKVDTLKDKVMEKYNNVFHRSNPVE